MDVEIFELNCPHCDKLYKLPHDKVIKHAGKSITCRRCGQPFSIPAPPSADDEINIEQVGEIEPEVTVEPEAVAAAVPLRNAEEDASYFAGVTPPDDSVSHVAISESMAAQEQPAVEDISNLHETVEEPVDEAVEQSVEMSAMLEVEVETPAVVFSDEDVSAPLVIDDPPSYGTSAVEDALTISEPVISEAATELSAKKKRRSKKSSAPAFEPDPIAEEIIPDVSTNREIAEPPVFMAVAVEDPMPLAAEPEMSASVQQTVSPAAPVAAPQIIHVMPDAAVDHLAAIRRWVGLGAFALILIALAVVAMALVSVGVLPHRP